MDDFKLNSADNRNGVYILTKINNEFESIYLKVREKEKRIYSDEELLNLPFASVSNPHKKEWNLRAKSFQRFRKYLQSKELKLNILDLGCGNGWFCGQLSRSFTHNFYCVDINLTELTQAQRVFNSDNLKFIYADIFKSEFPNVFFDVIIINAAIQYFTDLKTLVDRCLELLKENGEVHIIDSPVYTPAEVVNARQRTKEYYSSMSFREMAENYHHHSWDVLTGYNYNILYAPHSITGRLKRLFSIKDSPFPWIKIKK